MEKKTEKPFRAKICIGHNEVLSTWTAVCPKCNEDFRLLWPFWVLQIPLHRVVDLRCPFCRYAYSLVAGTLPFWWPVIVVPRDAVTSVFAAEAPADDGEIDSPASQVSPATIPAPATPK